MIWLIGSKSMLGNEIAKQLRENKLTWIGTDTEVDVENYQSLFDFAQSLERDSYLPAELSLSERQIKWIINCYTYSNIGEIEKKCQSNIDAATTVSLNIARIARNFGAKLIQISSSEVFDGKGKLPYNENDTPAPASTIGKILLENEIAIQKEMNTYYIVRTGWLYGYDETNFLYTLSNDLNTKASIEAFSNQYGNPASAVNLAKVILTFIEKSSKAKSVIGKYSAPAYGIYHYADEGEASLSDFTQELYKALKKTKKIKHDCQINSSVMSKEESDKPAYSVLDTEKITKELKIKIPDWKISLEKFIKNDRFKVL